MRGPVEQQQIDEAIARRARFGMVVKAPIVNRALIPITPPSPDMIRARLVEEFMLNWPPMEPLSFTPPVWREAEPDGYVEDEGAPPFTVTLHSIIKAVALEFGYSLGEMQSVRRDADLVRARQVVMYLAKKLTTHSFKKIGMLVGGRDHTTVLHGVRKIEAHKVCDPEFSATVKRLEAKLSQ